MLGVKIVDLEITRKGEDNLVMIMAPAPIKLTPAITWAPMRLMLMG